MKRGLALLLVGLLLICTTACKKNNGTLSNNDTSIPTTESDINSSSSNVTTDVEPPVSSEQIPNVDKPDIGNTSPSQNDSSTPSNSSTENSSVSQTPSSDVEPPQPDINIMRKYYALGNCQNLKDRPVVMLFYIDDDESAWDEASVIDFTENQVKIGLDYLETAAKEWGVSLDFELVIHSTPHTGNVYKYEGVVEPDLRTNGSTKDVLDKAAQDLGYASNWEMHKAFESQYPNRDIIYLTFFNKKGVSYTRHQIVEGISEYAEHCVIFTDYLTSYPGDRDIGTRSATVAHELLHLFGAEDYYLTEARETLANEFYPTDIMLWQFEVVANNTIGDFTAFTLGWTDEVPEVCKDVNWWK